MAWYVAQIVERDGLVTVTFPDVAGVYVVNSRLELAVEAAGRVLAWEIESRRAKGINVPAPTPLTLLQAQGEASAYALVEV